MSVIDAYVLKGRKRRFDWIRKTIRRPPAGPLHLLDVGGTIGYWTSMPWQTLAPAEIVLLNMMPQEVS